MDGIQLIQTMLTLPEMHFTAALISRLRRVSKEFFCACALCQFLFFANGFKNKRIAYIVNTLTQKTQ